MCEPCRVTPGGFLARSVGASLAIGAGVTAYAVWESRAFTLRSVELPLLPEGAAPLRVLHLSDLHLTPGQSRKREWLICPTCRRSVTCRPFSSVKSAEPVWLSSTDTWSALGV